MGVMFQCDNVGVIFDFYLLGKVLGGGIVFVSVVVGDVDVLGVLQFGQYGLIFGGNFLVVVVGLVVVGLFEIGDYQCWVVGLGVYLFVKFEVQIGYGVIVVCGVGFWVGIDIDLVFVIGCDVCEVFVVCGVFVKDMYGLIICFVLLIVVECEEFDWVVEQLVVVFVGFMVLDQY